ncbi:MAG: carboxypeptidase-like regulatory domain-containing protein [Tannerella sp.]|nr:carboxypeptidase-like regulatory domain-containing protein [Tannerella sp.]
MICVVLCGLLPYSMSVIAGTNDFSVTGTVSDEQGGPLAGATVQRRQRYPILPEWRRMAMCWAILHCLQTLSTRSCLPSPPLRP